jgi:hypothetical protein
MPEFIPISFLIGPFTTVIVANELVLLDRAVMPLAASARIAGKYSDRAPAITALTATFSTVNSQNSRNAVGRRRPTRSQFEPFLSVIVKRYDWRKPRRQSFIAPQRLRQFYLFQISRPSLKSVEVHFAEPRSAFGGPQWLGSDYTFKMERGVIVAGAQVLVGSQLGASPVYVVVSKSITPNTITAPGQAATLTVTVLNTGPVGRIWEFLMGALVA